MIKCFSIKPKEKLIFMLTVYFDESYNHLTDKEPKIPLVYTVGGYLSTVQQWIAFESEWSEVLKKENIPYFHMADFESGFSYYKGWSKEKRIRFLQKLHEIIHKYVLKGFVASIVLSDYDKLTAEQKEIVFGEPHMCALFTCMKKIVTMCDDLNLYEPIAFVFENSAYNGQIIDAFDKIPDDEKQRYRVGTVSFAGKEVVPLQASDILSYEVMKGLVRIVDENNSRKPRASILNLAAPRIDEWYYLDKEEFEKVLVNAKKLGLWADEI
jgi:hypothetical protein